MITLYLHIPYCASKCDYCSFYSNRGGSINEYIEALIRSIEYHGKKTLQGISSVYIGGGTPSVIGGQNMLMLGEAIKKHFDMEHYLEYTMEFNPDSTNLLTAGVARMMGVNRISLGVQSLNDKELSAVGRIHNSKQALKAIEVIRDVGVENINCDLIMGLPHQTVESFEQSLKTLIDLGIPHISCYDLQLEPGTPLYERRYDANLPDFDVTEQMYYRACALLKDAGYDHYEVSNFAKPGYQCGHNRVYWAWGNYIGLGPSAHSKLGDTRYSFDADVKKFISRTEFEFDKAEVIKEKFFEQFMLRMRTDRGENMDLLTPAHDYIKRLVNAKLARIDGNYFKLTDTGLYLSNTIITDILVKLDRAQQKQKKEEKTMTYTYKTQGVCSRSITIELENGIIRSCEFEGGCNGNTQGICALVENMKATEAIDRLEGIVCGYKSTSCPDQLAKALTKMLEDGGKL